MNSDTFIIVCETCNCAVFCGCTEEGVKCGCGKLCECNVERPVEIAIPVIEFSDWTDWRVYETFSVADCRYKVFVEHLPTNTVAWDYGKTTDKITINQLRLTIEDKL